MKKPNSKLCVLVEPKEFSTNAIINFCDETFSGRGQWAKDAIVLMTKFDKQLEDSRSGSKANKFFSEYHENGMTPYLTITPTLDREDLSADELFLKRKHLLETATAYEEDKFVDWKATHAKYRETDPDDPKLLSEVSSRIGFSIAKDKMREVMLIDTATRLPEVLSSLRSLRKDLREELAMLEGRKKFHDPNYLRLKIGNLLQDVCDRISDYLDGDLETAAKFPEKSMDLDDELELEEDSEWFDQTLGNSASTEDEQKWRNIIDIMVDQKSMPLHVRADQKLLGGKQFQRAFRLLAAAMDEAFPDITAMKKYVASGAGYLQGGLQRENWERATLSIVKMTASMTVHPGVSCSLSTVLSPFRNFKLTNTFFVLLQINFFIKHVGAIFRNLFQIALEDTKLRSVDNARLLEICSGLEHRLVDEFDEQLWLLLETAADKTHLSLEPMFSILNPQLPNFHPVCDEDEEEDEDDDLGIKTPSKKKKDVGVINKLFSWLTVDDKKAKGETVDTYSEHT